MLHGTPHGKTFIAMHSSKAGSIFGNSKMASDSNQLLSSYENLPDFRSEILEFVGTVHTCRSGLSLRKMVSLKPPGRLDEPAPRVS